MPPMHAVDINCPDGQWIASGYPLVRSMARRYSRPWTTAEDLEAAGRLALVLAARRFPADGRDFPAFAAKYVKGAIVREMFAWRSIVRVSPKVRRRLRSPDPAVVARAHREVGRAVRSGWGHGDEAAANAGVTSDGTDLIDRADEAAGLMAVLDPRELTAIRMRFGMDGPEMDTREISEVLGIGPGWTRRIIGEAIRKMRARAVEIDPAATLGTLGRTDGTIAITGNDDVVRMVAKRLAEGEAVLTVGRELGISAASVRKARGIAREQGWLPADPTA